MASIWRHPKSQFFTACWTHANGCRKKRSTKETDKRKAQKRADFWELESRTKRTEIQVRRVLEDIHREISGVTISNASVREHFTAFIEAKRNEKVSKATLA